MSEKTLSLSIKLDEKEIYAFKMKLLKQKYTISGFFRKKIKEYIKGD